MRELIQLLVEQLVNPGAVEIKEAQVDAASVIELRVAKEDLAGPSGSRPAPFTRSALFSTAIALRNNRKVILQVIEGKGRRLDAGTRR